MPQVLLVLGLRLSGMFLLMHAALGGMIVAVWKASGRGPGADAFLMNRQLSETLLGLVAASLLIAMAPRIALFLTPVTGRERAGPTRLLLAALATIGVVVFVGALPTIASLLLYRAPRDAAMWAVYWDIDGQNLRWYVASALAGLVAALLPLLWSRLRRGHTAPEVGS